MKLQIHVNNIDEELLMRVIEGSLAGKSFTTPIKSLNRSIHHPGVNEIYHNIDAKKIAAISSSTSEEMKFNNSARRDWSEDQINLLFLSYKEISLPDDDSMAIMADLQYVNSDIAIVPLCPGIIKSYEGDKLLNNFIGYVQKYLSVVETLNNKTIIGIIPAKLPRQLLPSVLDFYHSKGITSFVIDSDGSSIYSNPSWLKAFQRKLYKSGIKDEGLIYNINSFEGRFLQRSSITLARDFITLTFGIDILGANHKPPAFPAERKDILDPSRKGPRVFDSETYGYVRVIDPALDLKTAKANNISSQHKETLKLQHVIAEEFTASSYLQRKPQIAQNKVLDRVRDVKMDIARTKTRQKSLFDK